MSNVIPEFNENGVLPPGDYVLTFQELKQSHLVKCDPDRPTWDFDWRLQLVENLEIVVSQLWKVGITEIFINGSFVEEKDHPNDIDGYFSCDKKFLASGELERQLNACDPHKVWTWEPASRVFVPGFPKKQLPMWNVYRVELFPHFDQVSGIKDAFGNALTFPSAFRLSRRNGIPKGIVKIVRGDLQ